MKFYGDGSNKVFDLVYIESTEESIVLASQKSDTSEVEENDVVLMKFANDGSLVTELGFDVGDDEPSFLKLLDDGRTLVLGFNELGEGTAYWFKLDAIDLNSVPVSDMKSLPYTTLTDVIETTETDGIQKFVLFGHTINDLSTGNVRPSRDMVLRKVTYDTDSINWTKYNGSSTQQDFSMALIETSSGSMMLSGSTFENGRSKILTYLVTNRGTSEASGTPYSVGINTSDVPKALIESSNNYTLVGQTGDRAFAAVLSSVGQLKRTVFFSRSTGAEQAAMANAVAETVFGEQIVVGTFLNFDPDPSVAGDEKGDEVMVAVMDYKSGELSNNASLLANYGASVGQDSGDAVIALPDGDVLVASTVHFGGDVFMIGLFRLNRFGELKN